MTSAEIARFLERPVGLIAILVAIYCMLATVDMAPPLSNPFPFDLPIPTFGRRRLGRSGNRRRGRRGGVIAERPEQRNTIGNAFGSAIGIVDDLAGEAIGAAESLVNDPGRAVNDMGRIVNDPFTSVGAPAKPGREQELEGVISHPAQNSIGGGSLFGSLFGKKAKVVQITPAPAQNTIMPMVPVGPRPPNPNIITPGDLGISLPWMHGNEKPRPRQTDPRSEADVVRITTRGPDGKPLFNYKNNQRRAIDRARTNAGLPPLYGIGGISNRISRGIGSSRRRAGRRSRWGF